MTNQKQSEPPSPVSVCAHPNPPCFEPLEPRTLLAASMIDDLNPHPIELAPDAGVRLGKALLFPLTTEHGRELWRSSGTRKATALVRDIKPGRDSSNPEHLTRAGDAVFFSVSNTYNDHTLWKTDGSRTGTTKVRSFEGTGIPSIAAVGRRAVLVANGQLWTTDGSRDGTVKLVGDGLTRVHPTLFRYGNQILFTTSDTGGGASDVWSTDGTLTGTRQIPTAPRDLTLSTARTLGDAIIYAAGGRLRRTDLKTTTDLRTINSDAFEARIIPLAVLDDDTLLFSANDGTHGHELWTTDGTPEGTRLLKDLAPGFGSSLPGYATRDFVTFDGLLFFTARVDGKERLFRSDGTDAGTFAIDRDLSDIQNLTLFRDRLYVSALNTSHQPVVLQPDRQRRFLTVSPNYHPVSSYVGAVNGRALYVRADQLGALWSGSAPHGRKSKPVFSSPHTRGSDPSNVLSVGDDLYFVTRMPRSDEYHWPDEADFALWRRSGNGKPVKLLEFEGGGYLVPDPFGNLTALPDGTVLFTVLTAYGSGSSHDPTQGNAHIWRTDGTPKGTYSLTADTGPVTNGYYFYFVQQTLFADQLFFLKTPTHEYFTMPGEPGELWTTDGTLDGTTKIANDVSDFTRFQGALHYGTADGTIWRLDEDEPEQPRLVTSLPPHAGDTFINLSTSDDERLYFSAWRQFERMELWSTDGTAAGTERMGSRDHSLSYEPPFFRPVIASDGRAFFTLNTFEDGQAFTDLYATDGTADGTRLLRRFPTAEIYYDAAEHLTTVNDTLFFAAYEESTGRELWKSDGTPNGTVIVKDIVPGKGSSYPSELTARDGLLYLNTYIDSVTSRWRSDGTAEGTVPNTEHPQPLPDYPPLSITFGDARIYPHFDKRYGIELWISDDDDGQRLLLDLVPGPAGSNPTPLAIHNGKLIFSANDGIHGNELWELDLDD